MSCRRRVFVGAQSTMTNANVEQVVAAVDGQTLTLKSHGGGDSGRATLLAILGDAGLT